MSEAYVRITDYRPLVLNLKSKLNKDEVGHFESTSNKEGQSTAEVAEAAKIDPDQVTRGAYHGESRNLCHKAENLRNYQETLIRSLEKCSIPHRPE